ncbi:hypothetical protein PDESU_05826 [Pontiella desulfatans]|uniref:PEGA domain-containing protein n=1 Tax=Pontiella desulfatans TaxID=2750659 RepID=A0A6C2UAX7_PONDE|nr:PEGA domain-containing protein [Pontiella desulfatans]VGO17230.1 hypothetical protein PDESU_05826 [Pontiella desulfatans]
MKEKTWNGLVRGALLLALLGTFGCTSFVLTSTPSATIYEDGQKIGQTPYSFNLMSGYRAFTLKRYGYVEEEFTVTSLDPKTLHFDLQWVGRTRIDSRPPGAQLLRKEDGEILGTTPCGLHLASGERVVVQLKGYETVERDLVPNETYMVELKPTSGYKSAYYKDIMFVSDQGSVSIYDRVAGERIGVTPARLNVEAGAALEYRLPGFRSKYALVSRNAPHRIVIELEPLTQVTISGPAGAQVYRAGGIEKLGEVPYTVQVDGDALFEVKKQGCYDRSVAVSADSPSRLLVDLEEVPYKTIVTDPPGADVYRLGGLEKLGTSPFTTVIDGERVFEIKKKGYRPYVIGMGPSSPQQLSVPLSQVPRDDPDAAAIGTIDSDVVESF